MEILKTITAMRHATTTDKKAISRPCLESVEVNSKDRTAYASDGSIAMYADIEDYPVSTADPNEYYHQTALKADLAVNKAHKRTNGSYQLSKAITEQDFKHKYGNYPNVKGCIPNPSDTIRFTLDAGYLDKVLKVAKETGVKEIEFKLDSEMLKPNGTGPYCGVVKLTIGKIKAILMSLRGK